MKIPQMYILNLKLGAGSTSHKNKKNNGEEL